MKKTILFLILLANVLMVAAQDESPRNINLTATEKELVKGNNNFAFNLFRQTRDGESQILSPLSITYVLSLLNNGVTGDSWQEIRTVLGQGDVDADTINAFCSKLIHETATLDDMTRVLTANAIYMNEGKGNQIKPAFAEMAAEYYDVTPEVRNFYDGVTRDVINQWSSDHTEGMIPEILSENDFDPGAVSYLLNSLYFKGGWTDKFPKDNTFSAYFGANHDRMVQMMYQNSDFLYAQNHIYQAVVLPYGNMAYQMTVFLPWYGKTLDDVLDYLNGDNWNADIYEPYNVDLYLPSLETESDMDLTDILKDMGMPSPFIKYDITEFCESPAFISMVKQGAKIKLDEDGTEAAATTVVAVGRGGEKYAEFVADRPFLYVISEQSTGIILFMGQYMGEPIIDENPRQTITLNDDEKQWVKGNNDFAFNLFRTARNDMSQVLSPLSITFALGMLNNGAAGQTLQEINQVLGFGDAGADAINAFCKKMLTESGTLDNTTKAMIANTIFVSDLYHLQDAFVQKAQEYYDATPETRNFHDGQTLDVINQWASDHTEGLIEKILNPNEFDPDAVSYLLNAIYFKGEWTSPFEKSYTKEEPFDGGAPVPMMMSWRKMQYAETENFQMVRLPYGNKAYEMTIFLPKEGYTIDDVVSDLNGENWRVSTSEYDVELKIPRFEVETDVRLNDIMAMLGMPSAFDYRAAEFPYFCDSPVFIQLMKQNAKIKVDEEGTEAAAVTVIVVEPSGGEFDVAEFIANRPFLYTINENSTGAIFFIGQYMGETTSHISDIHVQEPTDNAIYDLTGRRLTTPPTRGIYIQNGQKIVVR